MPSLTVKVSQLNENTLNPEDLRKFREWSEGKRPTRVEREAKWRQEIETRIRSELGKQADEPELDLALKEKRKGMGQMIQRQANLENKISILEANEKRLEESLAKLSKLRRTQELSLKAVENRYQDLEKTNESLVKLNQTKKAELWNAKKKIDDLEAERGLAQRELLEKTKQWREAKESLRNTGFQVKVVEKKLEDVQRARMNDKLRFENQSRALSAEKDRALQEAFGPAFKMHRDPTQKALEKQLLESQVSRDKLKEQMEEVGQSRDSAILGLRKVNDRLKQMRDVIEAGKGRELELEKQLTVSAQKIEALENQLKKAVDERGTLKASYVIKDKAATERMAAIVKSFNKALLEKRDLERELENVKNQA